MLLEQRIAAVVAGTPKRRRKCVRMEAEICRHLPRVPKAMYDIGISIKSEWQTVKRVYPTMRLYGCEPQPHILQTLQTIFPGEIYGVAITGKGREVTLHCTQNNPLLASMFTRKEHDVDIVVPAITLTEFDDLCGKHTDVVLWMDVEGAELDALQSGEDFLRSGRVMAINLEERRTDTKHKWVDDGWAKPHEVQQFLADIGFKRTKQYNRHAGHQDVIYTWK